MIRSVQFVLYPAAYKKKKNKKKRSQQQYSDYGANSRVLKKWRKRAASAKSHPALGRCNVSVHDRAEESVKVQQANG